MQAIRSSKSWRKTPWRVRAVQLALALAGVGLTAIAAAAIGVSTKTESDGAMAAAILAQHISEGQATPSQAMPLPSTPPNEAATREQILNQAASYETEMHQSVEHADQLRLEAYHDKDLIRMNFIASKLIDMRQILQIAQPSFASIRKEGQDLFVMRAKLSTIRQGWERIKEELAAAETAESDSADQVTAVGAANAEANPSDGVTDPTLPPGPSVEVERPSAASPYR
ncbi:MAG TPA: hypothetical protein VK989_19990 [Polyangia bacterium]|jgi:hypothetical protein|nr:hypothetical protein [Polyangia bacterium]